MIPVEILWCIAHGLQLIFVVEVIPALVVLHTQRIVNELRVEKVKLLFFGIFKRIGVHSVASLVRVQCISLVLLFGRLLSNLFCFDGEVLIADVLALHE